MGTVVTADEPQSSQPGTPAGPRRKPSTGFPVVALPEAAKIIREAGKYGFEHSVSAFARYMGHSSTNSGAFRQRLAAFRDWKLIAGRGDTVVFTEAAKTIALPTDSQAERGALQTAFMNCAVFNRLYEGVTKEQPVEAQLLGAKAVHELGVSPSAVDRFAASFIGSAVAAGLAVVENGQVTLLDPGTATDSPDPGVDGPASTLEPNQAPDTGAQTPETPVRLEVPSPVVHQEWPLPAGAVVFEVRLDRPLPAAVFAQIGAVVEQIETLANGLREVATGEPEAR